MKNRMGNFEKIRRRSRTNFGIKISPLFRCTVFVNLSDVCQVSAGHNVCGYHRRTHKIIEICTGRTLKIARLNSPRIKTKYYVRPCFWDSVSIILHTVANLIKAARRWSNAVRCWANWLDEFSKTPGMSWLTENIVNRNSSTDARLAC